MKSDEICEEISKILFPDIEYNKGFTICSTDRESIKNLLKILVINIKQEIIEEDIKSLQKFLK